MGKKYKILFSFVVLVSLILLAFFVKEKSVENHDLTELAAQDNIADDTSGKPDYVPGQLIVKFKKEAGMKINQAVKRPGEIYVKTGNPSLDELNAKYGVSKIEKIFTISTQETAEKARSKYPERARRVSKAPANLKVPDLENIYKLSLDGKADLKLAAEEYGKDPAVEYAEPDYLQKLNYVPNDVLYPDQWAHQSIDSESAWDIEKGNPEIVIAIIDTGVDYNHEDLKTNIWTNPFEIPDNGIDEDENGFVDDYQGWDFQDQDNDPMPDFGTGNIEEASHGTMCAGVAAAIGNNQIGISGVCPKCKIMNIKVTGNYATASTLIEAMKYAADNGAAIINNSWSINDQYSQALDDMIQYASSLGVVIVASAGNENSGSKLYLAGHPEVIGVASTDTNNQKSAFSNWGEHIKIAAPGENIKTATINNSYSSASGTSMSAPLVAGVAGLVLSKDPSLSKKEVEDIIVNEVDVFGVDVPMPTSYIGKGIVNALKVVSFGESPSYSAEIMSPTGGSVSKTLEIKGIANGASYVLEIGEGPYPTSWQLVKSGIKDEATLLATIDTTLYNEGIQTLRLTVNGSKGPKSDTVTIEINNITIEKPASTDFFHPGEIVFVKALFKYTGVIKYKIEYAAASAPDVWRTEGLHYSYIGGNADGQIVSGNFDKNILQQEDYYLIRFTGNKNGIEKSEQVKIGRSPYQAGWPKQIELRDGKEAEPMIADLDDDGDREIILVDAGGRINVWQHDGKFLPGWPPRITGFTAPTVAIGNIIPDDNQLELVHTSYPFLAVYNHDGSYAPGWPIKINIFNLFATNPVIYDVDGEKKILTVSTNSKKKDTAIFNIYNTNGTEYKVLETGILGGIVDDPSYADIVKTVPGNEIIIQTTDYFTQTIRVYVIGLDGAVLPGWPQAVKGVSYVSPIIADLDGVGDLEIIMSTGTEALAFYANGDKVSGWSASNVTSYNNPLAVGDMNMDSRLKLVTAINNIDWYDHSRLSLLDQFGKVEWENQTGRLDSNGSPVIGDLDGDGYPDILVLGDAPGKLLAYDRNGQMLEGWPKKIEAAVDDMHNRATVSPAIGDLDNDGDVEAIAVSLMIDTSKPTSGSTFSEYGVVNVFDLDAKYNEATMHWPMYQHDPLHTGYQDIKGSSDVNCKMIRAYWEPALADKGESVTLKVAGKNCDGKEISFQVSNNDQASNNPAESQPQKVRFSGDIAQTTWTAERHNLIGGDEYYFQAMETVNDSNNISSRDQEDGILTVLEVDKPGNMEVIRKGCHSVYYSPGSRSIAEEIMALTERGYEFFPWLLRVRNMADPPDPNKSDVCFNIFWADKNDWREIPGNKYVDSYGMPHFVYVEGISPRIVLPAADTDMPESLAAMFEPLLDMEKLTATEKTDLKSWLGESQWSDQELRNYFSSQEFYVDHLTHIAHLREMVNIISLAFGVLPENYGRGAPGPWWVFEGAAQWSAIYANRHFIDPSSGRWQIYELLYRWMYRAGMDDPGNVSLKQYANPAWFQGGLTEMFFQLEKDFEKSTFLFNVFEEIKSAMKYKNYLTDEEMVAIFNKVTGKELIQWFKDNWGIGKDQLQPADVNQDGQINIKDIQACIKVITKSDLTYEARCQAVAPPETVVNIKDIQAIIQAIVNPSQ